MPNAKAKPKAHRDLAPSVSAYVGCWITFTAASKVYVGLVVWHGNGVHYVAVVGFNGIMHVRAERVMTVHDRQPEPVSFTNP